MCVFELSAISAGFELVDKLPGCESCQFGIGEYFVRSLLLFTLEGGGGYSIFHACIRSCIRGTMFGGRLYGFCFCRTRFHRVCGRIGYIFSWVVAFVVRVGNKNPGCRCGGRECVALFVGRYEKGGVSTHWERRLGCTGYPMFSDGGQER